MLKLTIQFLDCIGVSGKQTNKLKERGPNCILATKLIASPCHFGIK